MSDRRANPRLRFGDDVIAILLARAERSLGETTNILTPTQVHLLLKEVEIAREALRNIRDGKVGPTGDEDYVTALQEAARDALGELDEQDRRAAEDKRRKETAFRCRCGLLNTEHIPKIDHEPERTDPTQHIVMKLPGDF